MLVIIGLLLVLLVGSYVCYPLWGPSNKPEQIYTGEQLQKIGEELEREIFALRQYPEHDSENHCR